MIQLGDACAFDDLNYEINKNGDVEIRVVDISSLINLKKDTYREIDRSDILFLKNLKDKNAGFISSKHSKRQERHFGI